MLFSYWSSDVCSSDLDTKVSRVISALNSDETVAYTPAHHGTVVPPGSVITHVHANRSYDGNATLQTHLCWNGTVKCVRMTGGTLNSHAFDGLDACNTTTLHLSIGRPSWRDTVCELCRYRSFTYHTKKTKTKTKNK